MKLFEYQGKELFRKYGLAVPQGTVIEAREEIGGLFARFDRGAGVVLKAQVLGGGRGKAGAVRFAASPAEAGRHYDELMAMTVAGSPVQKVLLEERLEIEREFYLAVVVDTEGGGPLLLVCRQGGVDVEEVSQRGSEALARVPIDAAYGLFDYEVREALLRLGFERQLFGPFIEAARGLYRFFSERDAILAEINPLVLAREGRLIAADARVEIDSAALFRQEEIKALKAGRVLGVEERLRDEYQLEYVELDGNIGLISGGAGLTMTAIDCLRMAGGRPACFMDCSANVSPTGYEMALRTLLDRPEVDCILINIFGGITRMDRVGQYLLEAMGRIGNIEKPLVIRLEGTDAEKGRQIVKAAGLPLCGTFSEAIAKAVELGGRA